MIIRCLDRTGETPLLKLRRLSSVILRSKRKKLLFYSLGFFHYSIMGYVVSLPLRSFALRLQTTNIVARLNFVPHG
jgi:hypothetical protein